MAGTEYAIEPRSNFSMISSHPHTCQNQFWPVSEKQLSFSSRFSTFL